MCASSCTLRRWRPSCTSRAGMLVQVWCSIPLPLAWLAVKYFSVRNGYSPKICAKKFITSSVPCAPVPS